MKRKVGYKICCMVLTAVLLGGNGIQSSAAESSYYAEGYIPDSTETIEAALLGENEIQDFVGTLPSTVDLSTSKYFPPIGNQGGIGSCSAFATAYYQFTYEANKLNEKTSDTDAAIASAKYVYNYVNGGVDDGSCIADCYGVLERFGCVSQAEFPYSGVSSEKNYQEWCTDTEAMRKALSCRLSAYRTVQITDSEGASPITGAKDSDLTLIKEILAGGKVLVVTTNNRWDAKNGYGTDQSKCVAYRCHRGGGHALTVVGYNDNIRCDVNGNGIIEPSEKGAFKVANSWGKGYFIDGISSQDGYFWVLYDALNGVSANKVNDWESSCEGTRCTAFRENNTFWLMYVENKEVNFVGELDLTTTNRDKLYLASAYSSANSSVRKNEKQYFPIGDMNQYGVAIPHSGKLLFDYSKEPIQDYYTGYRWYVKFRAGAAYSKSNFAITDSLGNVVSDFGKLSSSDSFVSRTVSLTMGDVDMDGRLTASDSLAIQQYVAKNKKFSNVQKFLGDMDEDGRITASDSLIILQIIAGLRAA